MLTLFKWVNHLQRCKEAERATVGGRIERPKRAAQRVHRDSAPIDQALDGA
jgi:hypothetical protein